MKNLKDPIGNRIRYLPVCTAVSHPTALPRTASEEKVLVLTITDLQHQCIQVWYAFKLPVINRRFEES
jgi:hypothetical protein